MNTSCPISDQDREWIEERLDWIHQHVVDISSCPIVLPNKKFFPFKFKGDKQTIIRTFTRVCEYFEERPTQFTLKLDHSDPVLDGFEHPQRPTWTWEYHIGPDNKPGLVLNARIAEEPDFMIHTFAGFLSYHKLLKLDPTGEIAANQVLRELTEMAYGFGYFLADQAMDYKIWGEGAFTTSMTWQKKSDLPFQVIGYTLAYLVRYRTSTFPKWSRQLKHGMDRDFQKSWKFLDQFF